MTTTAHQFTPTQTERRLCLDLYAVDLGHDTMADRLARMADRAGTDAEQSDATGTGAGSRYAARAVALANAYRLTLNHADALANVLDYRADNAAALGDTAAAAAYRDAVAAVRMILATKPSA